MTLPDRRVKQNKIGPRCWQKPKMPLPTSILLPTSGLFKIEFFCQKKKLGHLYEILREKINLFQKGDDCTRFERTYPGLLVCYLPTLFRWYVTYLPWSAGMLLTYPGLLVCVTYPPWSAGMFLTCPGRLVCYLPALVRWYVTCLPWSAGMCSLPTLVGWYVIFLPWSPGLLLTYPGPLVCYLPTLVRWYVTYLPWSADMLLTYSGLLVCTSTLSPKGSLVAVRSPVRMVSTKC
jgi:hypothetical protein